MPRIGHGEVATPEQLQQAERDLASQAASIELGFAVAAPAGLQDFDFLFLELQDDDANLLPKSATTVKRLKELGATMQDPGACGDPGDANIPAIYTYFGQFIDHDITPLQDRRAAARRRQPLAGDLPEIFRLNRDIISDPDRISPGQVLVILPS
jgi:hypothetical protein